MEAESEPKQPSVLCRTLSTPSTPQASSYCGLNFGACIQGDVGNRKWKVWGFFFPNLLTCGLITQGEPQSDWNLVDSTDASGKCVQIISQFNIIPKSKDQWVVGLSFSSLRLFSGNWCLKAGYRQNSLAMRVILHCLASLLFSLSAFLCLAFHLWDCIWKARHVNSIRARSLLEWNESLTQARSCPRKCQNNSPSSCSWGGMVVRSPAPSFHHSGLALTPL